MVNVKGLDAGMHGTLSPPPNPSPIKGEGKMLAARPLASPRRKNSPPLAGGAGGGGKCRNKLKIDPYT